MSIKQNNFLCKVKTLQAAPVVVVFVFPLCNSVFKQQARVSPRRKLNIIKNGRKDLPLGKQRFQFLVFFLSTKNSLFQRHSLHLATTQFHLLSIIRNILMPTKSRHHTTFMADSQFLSTNKRTKGTWAKACVAHCSPFVMGNTIPAQIIIVLHLFWLKGVEVWRWINDQFYTHYRSRQPLL